MKKNNLMLLLLSIMALFSQNTLAVDRYNYVVKFYDEGLLYYTGGINNIKSTSPQFNGDKKFQARSPEVLAYSSFLNTLKNERVTEIKNAIGSDY